MGPHSEPLISSITVDSLFGLYSYSLPQKGALPNAAILYGDNGLGKTTILRLIFHLLSADGNKGHRTALYNTPFNKLEINLASGASATATRARGEVTGPLTLKITHKDTQIALWEFEPEPRGRGHNLGAGEYVIERGPRALIALTAPPAWQWASIGSAQRERGLSSWIGILCACYFYAQRGPPA
jgi:hypothetical protein